MPITTPKQKISDGMRALLIWRNLEFTNENIKNIDISEITCIYRAFPKFSIIRLSSRIEDYRKEYTRKTNKDWKTATINEIFKAEMVW